jgi:sugar phosphate isomerase/epimerase
LKKANVMKLGILTGLWFVAHEATVLESIKSVNELGFRYIDLHGTYHAGPHHLSSDEIRRVKVDLNHSNMEPRCYVLHSPLNIASATNDELEYCVRFYEEGIEIAAEWNINQIMLNAGQWAWDKSRIDSWNTSVSFLRRVCDHAAKYGIFISLEAEPYVWYMLNDLRSSIQMMNDIDRPNVAVVVDLGHMALAREGAIELGSIADTIIHAHASDHEVDKHTNQILGTGFARLGDYLLALHEMEIDKKVNRFGYEELVISFELGFPGDQIQDPQEWVNRSINHIRKLAPFVTL